MFIRSPVDPLHNPEGTEWDRDIRTCKVCHQEYDVREAYEEFREYWDEPVDYASGSSICCLACWL